MRRKCSVVLKISPTIGPIYHYLKKLEFIVPVLIEETTGNSMCIALIRIINFSLLHLIVGVESFEPVLQIFKLQHGITHVNRVVNKDFKWIHIFGHSGRYL